MARRKQDFAPQIDDHANACAAGNCEAVGQYKAPKAPNTPGEHQWLCLEHAREFNQQWDYFDGMSQVEIEHFIKEAVTGHRPTWLRDGCGDTWKSGHTTTEQLEAALHSFLFGQTSQPGAHAMPPINSKEREALAILGLDAMVDDASLKELYRKLVKENHPDLHQGDKDYEERFKRITAAYIYLKHQHDEQ